MCSDLHDLAVLKYDQLVCRPRGNEWMKSAGDDVPFNGIREDEAVLHHDPVVGS